MILDTIRCDTIKEYYQGHNGVGHNDSSRGLFTAPREQLNAAMLCNTHRAGQAARKARGRDVLVHVNSK